MLPGYGEPITNPKSATGAGLLRKITRNKIIINLFVHKMLLVFLVFATGVFFFLQAGWFPGLWEDTGMFIAFKYQLGVGTSVGSFFYTFIPVTQFIL